MKLEYKIMAAFGLLLVAVVSAIAVIGRTDRPIEPELVIPLTSKVKGFDPVQSNDVYSSRAVALIYEPLYQYHYLKRPYRAIPCLADGMPQVSDDGLTLRIGLKKNVRFQDDPCFPGGKGRTVTAQDAAFSLKRLANAKTRTKGYWLLRGKIVGMDDYYETSTNLTEDEALGRDFAFEEVEGIRCPDEHTLELRLVQPYPQLIYVLTMTYTAVVPHEAVFRYGKDFVNHPVGTGPYRLERWVRNFTIDFVKNPTYHGQTYPTEGEPGDRAAGLLKDAGKPLPRVERVRYRRFGEPQVVWLQFLRKEADFAAIPTDSFQSVISPVHNDLTPEYREMGIRLATAPKPQTNYIAFNMEHPVFGQPAGEKGRKIRQAMSMAVNRKRAIELIYNGRGVPSKGPIPPGFAAYRADADNPYCQYNPERARELLAEAGHPGGEGLPEFTYDHPSRSTSQQLAELFIHDMAEIGIRVKRTGSTWPRFLEKVHGAQCDLWGIAWVADYPDAENFLMLFYGGNRPTPNTSRYHNPDYDALFEKARTMQPGHERMALYHEMERILQRDCPWIFNIHPEKYSLHHGWIENYKIHGVGYGLEKYYGMDLQEMRERMRR